MDVRSLRIGNYLNYCDNTVEILATSLGTRRKWNLELGYFKESIGFERDIYDDNIKPIPLTKQWLLDFGFEKDEDFYVIKGTHSVGNWGDYSLAKSNQRGYWGLVNEMDRENLISEVKYVHQIQNLYHSLCGEELTFKEVVK